MYTFWGGGEFSQGSLTHVRLSDDFRGGRGKKFGVNSGGEKSKVNARYNHIPRDTLLFYVLNDRCYNFQRGFEPLRLYVKENIKKKKQQQKIVCMVKFFVIYQNNNTAVEFTRWVVLSSGCSSQEYIFSADNQRRFYWN